jgi:hypothetical protein
MSAGNLLCALVVDGKVLVEARLGGCGLFHG